MGILYLVATPIGNLEDISARGLRVLREVSLVAAEDTRHTGRLLARFGIETKLLSLHAHNERGRRETILAALAGGDVALVSDAGTPGISDPGQDLVAAVAAAGFQVSPVPGPSAVTAAVGASGLVAGPFVVLGFLPRRGAERAAAIGRAGSTGYPLVVFEAPGRLVSTLDDLRRGLGDREAAVCRELTKLHEEIGRGRLSELGGRYGAAEVRGEVVVVVGAGDGATNVAEDDASRLVGDLLRAGLGPSQAAREAAAATGLPRSTLYGLARALQREGVDDASGNKGGT